MTDSSQSVQGTINYDSFGNTVGTTGSSSDPYMFAATSRYRTDGDAGLMQVGARYYDSQVGRFITRDTDLSEHPYLYCDHDPINFTDADGHDRQKVKNGLGVVIGAIVVGGAVLGGVQPVRPTRPPRPEPPPITTPVQHGGGDGGNGDDGDSNLGDEIIVGGVIVAIGLGVIFAPQVTIPLLALAW